MLNIEQRERYLRHILLKEVGAQGQHKLLSSRVLIVGAGGIGSPLMLYLAAAGVGAIGIADDDEVALSNLQRQVIFSSNDLGAPKTMRAHAAITRLNRDVEVIEHAERMIETNAKSIIEGYDLVAEGIDNFEGRYVLNRACMTARKPLISVAVGRFEGQLAVFKPYAGAGLPCYRCLAPEPPPRDQRLNCEEEGVLGALTGVMGTLAALEVLKEILGIGDALAGKLLHFDGLAMRSRTIALHADPACKDCGTIERAHA